MHSTFYPYRKLCAEYYQLDKPSPPLNQLSWFLNKLRDSKSVLEPMCGSGRFLIPLKEKGVDITGFDSSKYMIEECKKRCADKGLEQDFFSYNSFETYKPTQVFSHIIIPSGSFCLITDTHEAEKTLMHIYHWLKPGGCYIFEVETLHAALRNGCTSTTSWVERVDGTYIVLHTHSKFDSEKRIQTSLQRYELWSKGTVQEVECETFKTKLYEEGEIFSLLSKVGFKIHSSTLPYSSTASTCEATEIQIECLKD